MLHNYVSRKHMVAEIVKASPDGITSGQVIQKVNGQVKNVAGTLLDLYLSNVVVRTKDPRTRTFRYFYNPPDINGYKFRKGPEDTTNLSNAVRSPRKTREPISVSPLELLETVVPVPPLEQTKPSLEDQFNKMFEDNPVEDEVVLEPFINGRKTRDLESVEVEDVSDFTDIQLLIPMGEGKEPLLMGPREARDLFRRLKALFG